MASNQPVRCRMGGILLDPSSELHVKRAVSPQKKDADLDIQQRTNILVGKIELSNPHPL